MNTPVSTLMGEIVIGLFFQMITWTTLGLITIKALQNVPYILMHRTIPMTIRFNGIQGRTDTLSVCVKEVDFLGPVTVTLEASVIGIMVQFMLQITGLFMSSRKCLAL